MPSDTKNVKLGVCRVYLDNVDLGFTKGGVEVEVNTETYKVEVDQFGKSPINEVILSREVTVSLPLAETTLENMVGIMPGATLVTDAVDPLIKKVSVPTGIGIDLLSIAKPLRLHPISKPDSDKSEDFLVPLAATPGSLSYAYKLDEERIFNTTFMGYPDPTTGVMFVVGNPDATE
jgi:hypothetical protein